jgi:hypothetical protein
LHYPEVAFNRVQQDVQRHGVQALDRLPRALLERAERFAPNWMRNQQEQHGENIINQRGRDRLPIEDFGRGTLRGQEGIVNNLEADLKLKLKIDEAKASEDVTDIFMRILRQVEANINKRYEITEKKVMTGQLKLQAGP